MFRAIRRGRTALGPDADTVGIDGVFVVRNTVGFPEGFMEHRQTFAAVADADGKLQTEIVLDEFDRVTADVSHFDGDLLRSVCGKVQQERIAVIQIGGEAGHLFSQQFREDG